METGIPARLTAAEGRKFGLTVGAAFLALSVLLYWRGRLPAAMVMSGVAVGLLLGGLLVPLWLGPVQAAWMGLSRAISKVTTPIFLGVVYFVVFTPVGLVMRAFGRRPLSRPRGGPTYWIARTGVGGGRGDLERQF